MIKKIILGVLFVGLSGFLIFGAVNRTLAKTNDDRKEVNGGVDIKVKKLAWQRFQRMKIHTAEISH